MKSGEQAGSRLTYSVGAALVTVVVPYGLLVLAVLPGSTSAAATGPFPWAAPAFVGTVTAAVCLTVIAWLVPGLRRRHLASGATVGLLILAMLVLFLIGGLDARASYR